MSSLAKPTSATYAKFHEAIAICQGCERWNGDGCLLLQETPCQIESHLLEGGGCVDDPPKFGPIGKHPRPERRARKRRATRGTIDVTVKRDVLNKPTSQIAVVTVAAGRHAEDCRKITRERMRSYADRIGADFVELSGDMYPDYPMMNKFRLYNVAKKYDRTLYLDVDVLVTRDTPNIFCEVAAQSVGLYDEHRDTFRSWDWAQIQTDKVAHSQNMKVLPLRWSANGGVIVLPKSRANVYRPPARPMPTHWCSDQQLLTLRVAESGPVHLLSHHWNCIRNAPDWKYRWKESWMLHFNELTGDDRLRAMSEMDAHLTGDGR